MSEDTKRCAFCKRTLPVSKFYFDKKRKRFDSWCRDCYAARKRKEWAVASLEQKRKLYKTNAKWREERTKTGGLRTVIQKRIVGTRHRAKECDIPFNLDLEYLLNLFKEQIGCCYYTGVRLKIKLGKDETWENHLTKQGDYISLDRLDPEKGYVKGNVAWCTIVSNAVKNMLSEEELYSFCKLVLDNKSKRERRSKEISQRIKQ